MPEYVLNRDYVLRTTKGYTVAFKKGQPVFVPPLIEKDAVAIGAERADNGKTDILAPETGEGTQMSFEELREAMFAAFDLLVEKNESDDFTAQGVPKVAVVEKMIETDIDRKELVEAWTEYRAGKV